MSLRSSDSSRTLDFLNNQLDHIKAKKSLKLSNLKLYLPTTPLHDVVETCYQYLNSFDPPLKIDKLSLSNNQLDHLTPNLKLFKSIRYLDLHNNYFQELPSELIEFQDLEFLDLSNNKLFNLTRFKLSKLNNLKLLSIKNNRFKYLPPIIGELQNLTLLEVGENPLVFPTIETIKNLKKLSSDGDWVLNLKQYLINHANTLELKLVEQNHQAQGYQSHHSSHNSHSGLIQYSHKLGSSSMSSIPQISRSKSISETKTKASKAARRMGLIIKKPDDVINSSIDDSQETDNSTNSAVDFPSPLNLPNSSSSLETSFNLKTSPLPGTGSSMAPGFNLESPPTTPSTTQPYPQREKLPQVHSDSSINNVPGSNQNNGTSRLRSNTLLEIDKMLENTDNVDVEHKSGAYFRRLSTLEEMPIDETINSQQNKKIESLNHLSIPTIQGSNHNSNASSRNGSITYSKPSNSFDAEDSESSVSSHTRSGSTVKTPPVNRSGHNTLEASPTRPPTKKWLEHDNNVVIGASRKMLFTFSELHSSVRRFTGFCVDKKVSIKMVSLLYTTKTNIDTLVENLEIMEDSINNVDKIMESLTTCISSFKLIITLLGENFRSFVSNIDVCFIRMLYLTVYGSFNEIFNAYKLLTPNYPLKTNSSPQANDKRLKSTGLSINTNLSNNNDSEEVDNQLYDSIEVATSKAQTVFGELTRAISKGAVASAKTQGQGINPQVANKVKELTNICISSTEIIRRLKTKSITIRNNPSQTTKKMFWDDINLFLKAIIQTFSSVKLIMKDIPALNEIRPSMATLTKSTKDVTILLEASSYRSMSNEYAGATSHPPALTSIPSVSNIFTPITAHPTNSSGGLFGHPNSNSQINLTQLQSQQPPVRTPLAAALGPAAQAIFPPSKQDSPQTTASPVISPNTQLDSTSTFTAPPQSSGQYYAKNGMNPFDGLIMANDNTDEDSSND